MDTADFIFVGSLVGFGVSAFASGWMFKRRHFRITRSPTPDNGRFFASFYVRTVSMQPFGPTRVKHVYQLDNLPKGAEVDVKVWELLPDDELPVGSTCHVEITAYQPDPNDGPVMADRGAWANITQRMGMLRKTGRGKSDANYITAGPDWEPPDLHIENFDNEENP